LETNLNNGDEPPFRGQGGKDRGAKIRGTDEPDSQIKKYYNYINHE
jgi:hypothetical protein